MWQHGTEHSPMLPGALQLGPLAETASIGSDYNMIGPWTCCNWRSKGPLVYENPREGSSLSVNLGGRDARECSGVTVLDFTTTDG